MPKVGASNSAASTVAALVDGIAWLLRKAGIFTGTPFMGSDWMRAKGLTAEPQNQCAGLLGEAVGGVAPMLAAAKATNIIEGLIDLGNRGKPAINTVANDLQSYRKTGRMADPPAVPQRSFSSDYPTGTGQQNGSRIALDINGAALSPTATIAGRSTVGGADKGLRGAGLESAIEALGARIGQVPARRAGQNLGRYNVQSGTMHVPFILYAAHFPGPRYRPRPIAK